MSVAENSQEESDPIHVTDAENPPETPSKELSEKNFEEKSAKNRNQFVESSEKSLEENKSSIESLEYTSKENFEEYGVGGWVNDLSIMEGSEDSPHKRVPRNPELEPELPPEDRANIFRVTNYTTKPGQPTDLSRCGDRYPAVFVHPQVNMLTIGTCINESNHDTEHKVPVNEWVQVEVGQEKRSRDSWFYVKINNTKVHEMLNKYPEAELEISERTTCGCRQLRHNCDFVFKNVVKILINCGQNCL